jgi:cytoskeletal protein CcmA (bactofilin family)
MFSKKQDNDFVSHSFTGNGAVATAVLSPSAYANTADANYSIINEWLVMKGDLESEADILVKGKIYGNVKCKMLIVDAGAMIEGGIEAEEVVIRGATKGVIVTKKVRLEKTAEVDSEIHHQSFSAEEGAKIRGALRFSDDPHGTKVQNLKINGADTTH